MLLLKLANSLSLFMKSREWWPPTVGRIFHRYTVKIIPYWLFTNFVNFPLMVTVYVHMGMFGCVGTCLYADVQAWDFRVYSFLPSLCNGRKVSLNLELANSSQLTMYLCFVSTRITGLGSEDPNFRTWDLYCKHFIHRAISLLLFWAKILLYLAGVELTI